MSRTFLAPETPSGVSSANLPGLTRILNKSKHNVGVQRRSVKVKDDTLNFASSCGSATALWVAAFRPELRGVHPEVREGSRDIKTPQRYSAPLGGCLAEPFPVAAALCR